ncbi:MAG TPA: beta-propeller fold lactonase family protein, partial [Puia sp.]|nr:beta-propeller fold lactonase family protein [Puia sp.]
MKDSLGLIAAIVFLPVLAFSQKAVTRKLPFEDSTLGNGGRFHIMPYNRLIRSAGKVISYGDSSLENHALDLCLLPDKKNIAIEDRYGIAVVNSQIKSIVSRWSFNQEREWGGFMSTYSGITSFVFKNKTFIVWGAASGQNDKSSIMIAEWDGQKINRVTGINIDKSPPAAKALPNQIMVNVEQGVFYLYVILNGNNQLLKIKFDDRTLVWSAPTGVAPFGLSIFGSKAYITNWAGPQVTDTTLENAGTPWGRAYTDPATGATKQGSLSIIDITNGSLLNELMLGLHPNAIIKSRDDRFLYIANGNSDNISVVDVNKEKLVDSIQTGLFSGQYRFYGSSPNALWIDSGGTTLYVANGMDNAVSLIKLGSKASLKAKGITKIKGFIPTEAYPSGIVMVDHHLYITNLEAR